MIPSRPPTAVEHLEKRVLVWVAGRREREVTQQVLHDAGLPSTACRNAAELIELMDAGAAAALVAEELLTPATVVALANHLATQPPWSDFPLVIFSLADKHVLQSPHELGNVTFLERPVRTRSMLAAVKGALRSRARQYEGRLAIESRDAFLAMLAHELRNPLSAISLASNLLASRSDKPSKELGVITRQTTQLTRLVDDLLDVARITHGKINITRVPVSLNEVARASFEALQQRASTHLEAFELELPNEELFVEGDKQRLEQVSGNLLTNAIKYTPPGGEVRLRVHSEIRDGDKVAVLEVSDNGVGIAPSMLARVFEPFSQVDTSLDRSQGGLGLGLALVQGIVQLHGGRVEAHSAGSGRGCTFRVYLPASAHGSDEDHEEAPKSLQRKLVVVDDNPDIRELLTALLEQAGHQVLTADDGPSGLERIIAARPDMAFIDIGLPGFDGFELARRARASGSVTKLIAITGYGRAEDTQESSAAGFDAHLIKPVSELQLRRLLAAQTRP